MIALYVAIGMAALYLICDALEKYAAVQELARLAFAVALLAFFLK